MISVEGLSFSYAQAKSPVLAGATFAADEGELLLVIGPSGGGKSTLLRCLNGLIPHFHGGMLSGRVNVAGIDPFVRQPRDLAGTVGSVFQHPESQVVAEVVEDEIAFGMENLGVGAVTMRKRVEEVLDLLSIVSLRDRRLATLSGGELQRVAIAGVLAMQPRVLLLDEPTSQLDPQAADELLTTVKRLNDDLGLTVLIAEHRLERVAQYADRILHVPGDGSVHSLDVREAMSELPFAPPVARLGRALGWEPIPLSVREGRRFTQGMSERASPPKDSDERAAEISISVRGLSVSHEGVNLLSGVSFEARPGEILAVMGRNGAGKTTLLRALVALIEPDAGDVRVLAYDVTKSSTEVLAKDVALVPQDPTAVFYRESVEEEILDTLDGTGRAGSVDETLVEWDLEALRAAHPADLSAGELQRTALAAMLAGHPRVALLDEPTRGMDYETKERLVANLRRRCNEGCTVMLASHDVELVGQCADRVLLLSEGRIVAEGNTREVLTESMTFSTQVNKLLGGTYLTPGDVAEYRAEAR